VADPKNAWMESWLNTQQNYWKAWSDMAQNGIKTPEAPKNPWADGINQWWQAVSPMAPPSGRDVFDKLMDVSRGYFSMAEKFMNSAGKETGMEAMNGWLENMQGSWNDWMKNGGLMRPDAQHKSMMTFWDLPLDTWQRLAANVIPMPGDFTHAFHPEGARDQMSGQVNRFLSIPAVGYSREFQEQYQILGQRMVEYSTAVHDYQTSFGKLAVETTQEFQASVQEMAKEGKSLGSLREIYDKWVEMSEAAYARFVMTQEYQSLYGRLVNNLLAVKQQMARIVDGNLEAMHMPTHAEISTLQRRNRSCAEKILQLRKDIKAIQQQLEAMRQRDLQPTPAPKAAAAKTPGVAKAPAAKAVAKPATKAPAKTTAKPAAKAAAPAKPAAKK
jgi:class III poly(R)-hydroxyalkanoic acid synthase PhaE subunit